MINFENLTPTQKNLLLLAGGVGLLVLYMFGIIQKSLSFVLLVGSVGIILFALYNLDVHNKILHHFKSKK